MAWDLVSRFQAAWRSSKGSLKSINPTLPAKHNGSLKTV